MEKNQSVCRQQLLPSQICRILKTKKKNEQKNLPVKFELEPFFPRLARLEASLKSTDPCSTCIVLGLGLVDFCVRNLAAGIVGCS